MIRIWLNRLFYLFRSTRNRLILVRYLTIHFDYSSLSTWVYITIKRAVYRVMRNQPCKLVIQSKFNGLHYPVIDIDDSTQLSQALSLIEARKIAYVVLQSSISHYWIILDYGHRKFYDANKILNLLGVLGDTKYYDMSCARERYFIRAIDTFGQPSRQPLILTIDFPNQIPRNGGGQCVNTAKTTETGAWRASYYQYNCPNLSQQYSANFSAFINKLREYYTTIYPSITSINLIS